MNSQQKSRNHNTYSAPPSTKVESLRCSSGDSATASVLTLRRPRATAPDAEPGAAVLHCQAIQTAANAAASSFEAETRRAAPGPGDDDRGGGEDGMANAERVRVQGAGGNGGFALSHAGS